MWFGELFSDLVPFLRSASQRPVLIPPPFSDHIILVMFPFPINIVQFN